MSKIFLILALLTTPIAYSNELDFYRMKCGQYLQMIEKLSSENKMSVASGVLMWLYGYASGQSGVGEFGNRKFRKFRKFATSLGVECKVNKDRPLLVMVKSIGIQ